MKSVAWLERDYYMLLVMIHMKFLIYKQENSNVKALIKTCLLLKTKVRSGVWKRILPHIVWVVLKVQTLLMGN